MATLSVTYGTKTSKSNGPLGSCPSSKSTGYGFFSMFETIPEEKEGVNHGFVSPKDINT